MSWRQVSLCFPRFGASSILLSWFASVLFVVSYQESLISAWLQFSDGSMTPLDNFNPAHFTLTATSLDEQVVAVQHSATWKWPVIVAKGNGQGGLVRLEMSQSDMCKRGKQHAVIAIGTVSVQVRLGQQGEPYRQAEDRRMRPDHLHYGGSIFEVETGLISRGATTARGQVPNGGRLPTESGPRAEAELPRSRITDEDPPTSRRGLTDLEIGMYALLGVFCLAILVFLINCIAYAYKYRSKQLSLETTEAVHHAHHWVWLGQEEGLCLQPQQDELEEGSQLLHGGALQGSNGCGHSGRDHRNESLNSPTTKRKRVKFTTFSAIGSTNSCPVLSPLALMQTSEIKWVCPEHEDPKDLRDYMDQLNENIG